jgi:hypothetical protein
VERLLGDHAVRAAAQRLRDEIASMPDPVEALRMLVDRMPG